MLMFHLLRCLSGMIVHFAACCGYHFVIVLIFTALVCVKNKCALEGNYE